MDTYKVDIKAAEQSDLGAEEKQYINETVFWILSTNKRFRHKPSA